MSIVEMIPSLLPEGMAVVVTNDVTRRQVARGSVLLDEHIPGWPLLVNRPLRMWSSEDCVLGQVYGSYEDGIAALGMGTAIEVAERFGFMPGYATALAVEWTRVINERRRELRH